MLGIPPCGVYHLVERRQLPDSTFLKIGARLYFRRNVLEHWLPSNGHEQDMRRPAVFMYISKDI